ncbi:MAG: DMT family transporter [Alphaproteobacteria bacterium]|nr:DMT family transporter [Alphaproteobacteria bacterium]
MSTMAWGLFAALSLIWGASFACIEIGLETYDPLTLAWLRVSVAALCLMPFWYLFTKLPSPLMIMGMMLLGLGNNVIPFGLIAYGQTGLTSSFASLLNATVPLFGIIYAHFLTKDEPFHKKKLIGILIGFLGLLLALWENITIKSTSIIYALAVLLAANSYAVSTVLAKRLPTGFLNIAFFQVLGASFILTPFCISGLWEYGLSVGSRGFWAIVVLGSVGTALAYVLFFMILTLSGAVNLMLVTLMVPAVALVIGITLLGEDVSLYQLSGLFTIILGLLIIDGKILPRKLLPMRKC